MTRRGASTSKSEGLLRRRKAAAGVGWRGEGGGGVGWRGGEGRGGEGRRRGEVLV